MMTLIYYFFLGTVCDANNCRIRQLKKQGFVWNSVTVQTVNWCTDDFSDGNFASEFSISYFIGQVNFYNAKNLSCRNVTSDFQSSVIFETHIFRINCVIFNFCLVITFCIILTRAIPKIIVCALLTKLLRHFDISQKISQLCFKIFHLSFHQ